MRFGKFIIHPDYTQADTSNHFLKDGLYGYFEFDRRGTDLYDRGGLATFKTKFSVGKRVKSVKLTATALGVFEVFVNGVLVGNDEMKPGWTDYNHRVFEFEYDISDLCKKRGQNVLVACVAPGWYGGRISNGFYGNKGCAFCAEITVVDQDGHETVFATDESWETAFGGCVKTSEIWDGELYDGREKSIFQFPESYSWKHAATCEDVPCKIVPHVGETVRLKKKDVSPVSAVVYRDTVDNGSDFGKIHALSKKLGKGCERGTLKAGEKLVVDFGVEFTARPRIKLYAPRDTVVRIYCGEMLNDSGLRSRGNDGAEGSLYLDNYRSALSRIQYISGGEVEEYTPRYTFFGYRYLEIVPDHDIEIFYVVSDIIGNDLKRTGTIETSNQEVNQFIGNVYRGLESNYLSIPTDCPQRDERLGWTGDTQIFCGAASYFVHAYGFLSKWMGDMRDSRSSDGRFPFLAPTVFREGKNFGAGAWSDAGIIVPYKMWLKYGDKTILEENYDAMELHLKVLYDTYGLEGPTPIFGDWLAYEETPKNYVSICYFYYDAILMTKISRLLNKPEREAYYVDLAKQIKAYYFEKFLESGEFKIKSQTAYILPLAFDMLEGELRQKAIAELKQKILDNDYTLTTGFVGTGLLNQTLSEVGLDHEAYSLLLQTKDPSWLYSVRQGATTVWERWNSYTIADGFGKVTMNSFNHYAYGAVAEWMFAYMAGIRPVECEPGFRKFVLAPKPDTRTDAELPAGQERITYVKAAFESAAGMIRASWAYENGVFTYRVTIPEGAVARVEFPIAEDATEILINDIVFKDGDGAEKVGNLMIFELSAGDYTIR